VNDIMVYNDSRIIDEINGQIEPLDETCGEWVKTLRQDVIPTVKAVVFFRKKPTNHINSTIASAHGDMLSQMSDEQKRAIAIREHHIRQALESEQKRKAIQRFQENWLRGKNDG